MDRKLVRKLYAAGFCVMLSLTGMTTGLRWLTVAALGLWVAAMLALGLGERPPGLQDRDEAV